MAAKKKKKTSRSSSASTKKTAARKSPTRKKKAARKAAASGRARSASADEAGDVGGLVGQVQRLIDIMNASGAVEVEVEGNGTKLRVRRQEPNGPTAGVQVVPYPAAASPADGPSAAGLGAPGLPDAGGGRADGTEFKSPMVGTFYRAPSPDSDPFVQVGDRVGPDTTLCILEAMKVMNEIKAETSAEVVEVLAQNGEPVEFGQPLFILKPI